MSTLINKNIEADNYCQIKCVVIFNTTFTTNTNTILSPLILLLILKM